VTADPLYESAAEPNRLREFVAALEAAGFTCTDIGSWTGPTRQSLLDGGFTESPEMTLLFLPPWPYLPPLLDVPGITAWHADQERLCLWRSDDSSQRWATLDGLFDRIDEWVADATSGFSDVENARNPEIYWQQDVDAVVAGLVDLDRLVGGLNTDGQHGEFHFRHAESADGRPSPGAVLDLSPGAFSTMTGGFGDHPYTRVRGRWFYRENVLRPPRDLDELRALLTDRQRERLDKDLRTRALVMFGVVWPNQAGLVATMLLSGHDGTGARTLCLVLLRPKGPEALLLRSGPDAPMLQQRTVAIIGAGAVGSFTTDALTRAGIGHLVLRDRDLLFPASLSRHAAPPGTPAGTPKTDALKEHLELYPWTRVDVEAALVWQLAALRDLLASADLTIDATGHGGFAELAGRVARDSDRPLLSVALFRGGTVARVRRQAAPGDTDLLRRPLLDRYPQIPPLPDELEYAGTETGCLAQIHNAPPPAVMHASALAAEIAIDFLTGRCEQPDEVIEVMRIGDPPFDQLGRLRPDDLPVTVDVTERALELIEQRTQGALPNETGGVLVGVTIDERTVVVAAVELANRDADPCTFAVPAGETERIVADARSGDERLGYVGDWHSHPSGSEPSDLDAATMLAARRLSGTERPVLLLGGSEGDGRVRVRAFVASRRGLVEATVCPVGDPLAPSDGAST
jgi:hypothetical protein